MLENQANGWVKQKKQENSIKTKEEVQREMIMKAKQSQDGGQRGGRDDGAGRGGRGGGRDRRETDNRRNDRRDVYMQKQSSTMSNVSNTSEGRRGGRGKGRDGDAQYKPKSEQQQQKRAEPIKLTEEQLQKKMQEMFSKFTGSSDAATNEEDKEEDSKVEQPPFQIVKDLL